MTPFKPARSDKRTQHPATWLGSILSSYCTTLSSDTLTWLRTKITYLIRVMTSISSCAIEFIKRHCSTASSTNELHLTVRVHTTSIIIIWHVDGRLVLHHECRKWTELLTGWPTMSLFGYLFNVHTTTRSTFYAINSCAYLHVRDYLQIANNNQFIIQLQYAMFTYNNFTNSCNCFK